MSDHLYMTIIRNSMKKTVVFAFSYAAVLKKGI